MVNDKVKNENLCKLIRDADKLDILNMYSQKVLELKVGGFVSEKVKQNFNKMMMVDNNNCQSSTDNIIKTLAFIYDINFVSSFIYLFKRK